MEYLESTMKTLVLFPGYIFGNINLDDDIGFVFKASRTCDEWSIKLEMNWHSLG